MKPLPLLLALPAASAYVTTTTWTTSRVVTVLSPQYHFYPIYASVVTANATATVYALDCQDNWHLDDDAPLAGCNGFTSLQAVIRVPTSTITEATFTATSTGSNGMRFVPPTFFPDLFVTGVLMRCVGRSQTTARSTRSGWCARAGWTGTRYRPRVKGTGWIRCRWRAIGFGRAGRSLRLRRGWSICLLRQRLRRRRPGQRVGGPRRGVGGRGCRRRRGRRGRWAGGGRGWLGRWGWGRWGWWLGWCDLGRGMSEGGMLVGDGIHEHGVLDLPFGWVLKSHSWILLDSTDNRKAPRHQFHASWISYIVTLVDKRNRLLKRKSERRLIDST